jgi:hypothetical protein
MSTQNDEISQGENILQEENEPEILVRYIKRDFILPTYEKLEVFSHKELENGRPKLVRFQIKEQKFYVTDDIEERFNEFNEICRQNEMIIKSILMRKLQGNDLTQLRNLIDVKDNKTIGFEICSYGLKKKRGFEFKFYNGKQKNGKNGNEVIINLHMQKRSKGLHRHISILDFIKNRRFRFPNFSDLLSMKELNYNDQNIYNHFKVEMLERTLGDYNAEVISQHILAQKSAIHSLANNVDPTPKKEFLDQ